MKNILLSFVLAFLTIVSASAQDAASAVWPLSTDSLPSLSGSLNSAQLKFFGNAAKYSISSYLTVNALSKVWSGAAEEEGTYIQFSTTAKSGSPFHADSIAFDVCGKGGSNMRANFYYSTDSTFATKTQMDYKQNMDLTRDNSVGFDHHQEAISVDVPAGTALYFRVYPYYKTASATGKFLCIKNVKIAGFTTSEAVSASVVWPYTSDEKAVTSGSVVASDMSYGSYAALYSYRDYLTLDGVATANGNFSPKAASCGWTAASGPVDSVYVQYAVTPKTGATLTVSDVNLRIGVYGTNAMHGVIRASKDAGFATYTTLQNDTILPYAEMTYIDYPLTTPIEVATGETYYVRVYPWMTSAATWKLVGIHNFTINGTVIGATYDQATLSVPSVSYISTTSVKASALISSDGGSSVTDRGFAYGLTTEPTIADGKLSVGDGSGSFTGTITGLTANTSYYVRPYAITKAGTSYGDSVQFTTLSQLVVPTVTITSSSTTNITATIKGNVSAWGGSDVTEKGVVLGTSADVTTSTGTKVASGSDLGSFQSYFDGLTQSTTYYVRAYAINSTGTGYSDAASIATVATDPDVTKTVSADGTGDYATIQAAFDAVPTNYTGRWIVKVAPGSYKEKVTLNQNQNNVYLIGQGKDASQTVITDSISAGDINPSTGSAWGTSYCQTMAVFGNDFVASNLTIANTFVNSTTNTAKNSNTQAVALKTQGDRQAFYNCRITGYQDTYLGNSIGRAYFKKCYIEGNVDFMFGRQTCVFDTCTTYVNRDGSVLVAPSTEKTTKYGFVFLNCDLTALAQGVSDFNGNSFSTFYYGRPWQNKPKAAFINCSTPATLNEKGWTTMNSGLSPVFVEYGCTGDGATADRLAKRGNEGVVLTADSAAQYTMINVFKQTTDPTNFAGDWVPSYKLDSDLNPTTGISSVTTTGTVGYNYPNPVASTTTIYYTLKQDSPVQIMVYGTGGNVVAQLINDSSQSAGLHTVVFNASSLATGVYFYSIKTNEGTTVHKIIKQ